MIKFGRWLGQLWDIIRGDLAQTAAATERFVSVDNRTSDQSGS